MNNLIELKKMTKIIVLIKWHLKQRENILTADDKNEFNESLMSLIFHQRD